VSPSKVKNAAVFRRQGEIRKEHPEISRKDAHWQARKELYGESPKEESPKKM
jgi:hypothetical protein